MAKVVSIYRDQYDVYIGRAGKGQDGYFGNPIRVGEYCKCCRSIHVSPGSTIPCFTKYFLNRINTDSEFRTRVLALKGLTLGCFCAPAGGLTASDEHRCHGQPILKWLETQ